MDVITLCSCAVQTFDFNAIYTCDDRVLARGAGFGLWIYTCHDRVLTGDENVQRHGISADALIIDVAQVGGMTHPSIHLTTMSKLWLCLLRVLFA